jgi:hypothetical protein
MRKILRLLTLVSFVYGAVQWYLRRRHPDTRTASSGGRGDERQLVEHTP